jgi:acyl dehydratase
MHIAPLPPAGWRPLARALLKRPSAAALPTGGISRSFECGPLDPVHVERYNALLGFRAGQTPITYFYLLAQRAHLEAMLSPSFPFRIAGLVHLGNDITVHALPDPGRPLTFRLTVHEPPPSKSGAVFVDLRGAFEQDDELAIACASRLLARRGRSIGVTSPKEEPVPKAWPEVARWHLPLDEGRRYARVSGDFNPIHLWRWSARLFGFERPIIHGMHTAARAVAAIESVTGAAVRTVSVRFRRPIEIGSDVTLQFEANAGEFEVWSGGRQAALGKVEGGSEQ